MEKEAKVKNVFTNKNFVLAFLGALVSNMGGILYSFAVSFYILSLTGNDAFIQGLYLATGGLTYTIVVLFGGVISDRFHKGKIMYICDYARGASIIILTVLLMTVITGNTGKIVALFILAVIGNFIGGIFSPASGSLLPHIVPEESFQQAQSYYATMNSFQSILGIVLAGILYSAVPINVLFLIVGGCYLLSGVSEMFIKYDHVKSEEKLTVKAAFNDIGTAFKYVTGFKPILYLIIAILFVNFFFSPVGSNFLPYFISTDVASNDYIFKDIMEPEMWNSILSVAVSIGSIIFAVVMSNLKPKEHISKGLGISFIILSFVFAALTILYVLFVKNIIDINSFLISTVVICFTLGVLLVTINIPSSTKLMSMVDKDKLGKVMSLTDIGSQGLIPLSNFLGGLVISLLGGSALLIACTVGFALTTAFIVFNKYIKQL
ncbi:MAG: MFS transporter [Bacilli bacterium]|nr:MFS transporter [Bacilli bacterium]